MNDCLSITSTITSTITLPAKRRCRGVLLLVRVLVLGRSTLDERVLTESTSENENEQEYEHEYGTCRS